MIFRKNGIKDLKNMIYEIISMITFCATGITDGDLVKGINIKDDKYITETLVTHKRSNM